MGAFSHWKQPRVALLPNHRNQFLKIKFQQNHSLSVPRKKNKRMQWSPSKSRKHCKKWLPCNVVRSNVVRWYHVPHVGPIRREFAAKNGSLTTSSGHARDVTGRAATVHQANSRVCAFLSGEGLTVFSDAC